MMMVNVECDQTFESEAERTRYVDANWLLKELKRHSDRLSKQEIMTLRGQALDGNVEGAKVGLRKLLERSYRHGSIK